jgi:hypothetical protein
MMGFMEHTHSELGKVRMCQDADIVLLMSVVSRQHVQTVQIFSRGSQGRIDGSDGPKYGRRRLHITAITARVQDVNMVGGRRGGGEI